MRILDRHQSGNLTHRQQSSQSSGFAVKLSVYNKEVRVSDFPETLSPEVADDRIVHLVKLYAADNSGTEVAIATGDFGMELRALAAKVNTLPLDPKLRLENPQDEQSRKLKQVQNELNTLKNRQPKLSLELSSTDGVAALPHEVAFELDGMWEPLDIEAEMEVVRIEHPKTSSKDETMTWNVRLSQMSSFGSSKEDWDDYDNELETFYEECRKHFSLLDMVAEIKSRSFSFDLWLSNTGGALANDIDICLTLPPSLVLIAELNSKEGKLLDEELEFPEPPKQPEPFSVLQSQLMSRFEIPDMAKLLASGHDIHNEWHPNVKVICNDDRRNTIHVRLGKIKHGDKTRLGSFAAVFGTQEDISPFSAAFNISTSDLIERISGDLPFITRVKKSIPDA